MTSLLGRRAGRRPTVLRLGWGIADQAVSSLENFLLGIYVARSLGAASLGALGLAFMTYAIIMNSSRGLATDPLMVRYSGEPSAQWRTAVASSSGVAILVGIASGLACAAVGVILQTQLNQPEVGSALIALGIGLPGLILQDSWRYAFFSSGQGGKAFANDVAWTGLLIVMLALGQVTGQTGVGWAVFAFGGSATLAALFGMVQSRIVPRPGTAATWLRRHRDLGSRFLVENVTLGARGQIRSFVVAATSGLASVGAIRGAEMLTGPVMALLMGIAQVAVPEAVRSVEKGRRALRDLCLALSVGLASISLMWGLIILVVFPHGVGELLLGSVWAGTHVLAPAVVLSATAGCFQVGPSAGLRALQRADLTVRTQLMVTVLYILFGTVGAVAWGARGTVWGTAAAAVIGAMIWWGQLRVAQREHFAPDPSPQSPDIEPVAPNGRQSPSHGPPHRHSRSVPAHRMKQ